MSELSSSLRRTWHSPGFKFFLIAFLILLLLIPLGLVMALIFERESRANSVEAEIARTWGGNQHISGPYLIVPYAVMVETVKGKETIVHKDQRHAVFLPESLNINAETKSDVLRRSIFDVNVFTASLTLKGRFAKPEMRLVDPDAIEVAWDDALFVVAISGVAGLKQAASLIIDGQRSLNFEPSLGVATARGTGIHARLMPLAAAETVFASDQRPDAFDYDVGLVFSGTSMLQFAPAARVTEASVRSDWPHPSFNGAFLPKTRNIEDTGFTATWQVPHLARSVPSAWSLERGQLNRFANTQFGVRYYAPVDFYDLVSRAAKYGILFLAFAFMTVFVMELMSDKRIHAVQYIFVGLAMIFFYVLLLSISEHIGFASAYAIASVATGSMLAVYFSKAFDNLRYGLAAAGLFILVYGLLYMILRLEDYALLAGALLGFAALTSVMFTTLRVNWSSAMPMPSPPARENRDAT